MKNKLGTFLFLFFCIQIGAQSNIEIAGVYLKRANSSYENLEFENAKAHFEKAVKYLDSVTNPDIARLGTLIYFDLKNYEEAKKYASFYFTNITNKKSEEYNEMLTLSVDINDLLEKMLIDKKRREEAQKMAIKQAKKIDSLKFLWTQKSKLLMLEADSIYPFNANNVAVFKKNNFFGLINDVGKTLVEANEYQDILTFDGYFIFKNTTNNPTKLYCYNAKNNTQFLLPAITELYTISTNYGVVMLPRGNGVLVAYPNNIREVLVYDLNSKSKITIADREGLLKSLKKGDIIDKFNNDGEVKINKNWYVFGGDVGGGIHPIFSKEGFQLEGFLSTNDTQFIQKTADYLGYFYSNSAQILKDSATFWINEKGKIVSETINETSIYNGNSTVKKVDEGKFHIVKDGFIILENEKVENLQDFLNTFLKN